MRLRRHQQQCDANISDARTSFVHLRARFRRAAAHTHTHTHVQREKRSSTCVRARDVRAANLRLIISFDVIIIRQRQRQQQQQWRRRRRRWGNSDESAVRRRACSLSGQRARLVFRSYVTAVLQCVAALLFACRASYQMASSRFSGPPFGARARLSLAMSAVVAAAARQLNDGRVLRSRAPEMLIDLLVAKQIACVASELRYHA